MDIHMPVMDGIEATRTIRALPDDKANIPIIAVTADTRPGHGENYLERGLDGYVIKPFTEEAILATLAQWLQPGQIIGDAKDTGANPVPEPVPTPTESAPPEATKGSDTAESHAALDTAAWDEAQSIYAGNPGGFRRFVDLFQENAQEKIAMIEAALEAGDRKAMHEAAHSLKSASGFIGASALAAACLRLEAATGDGQGEGQVAVAELVSLIVQEHRRATEAITTAMGDAGNDLDDADDTTVRAR
jgi:HPt (histidine-containing phosphotransfer) domain-containing protein